MTTRLPSTTNLDIGFPFTITGIPPITEEPPQSTTLKPLTDALTTDSTESPVTTSQMPGTTKTVPTTQSEEGKIIVWCFTYTGWTK